MEVKDLHSYVITFDNAVPKDILKNFQKICAESKKFDDARVIGKKAFTKKELKDDEFDLEKKIRLTKKWEQNNIGVESLTEVHWANFLHFTFTHFVNEYLKIFDFNVQANIDDIQILKYEKGGHYIFHVDSHSIIPRIFSCIFLVNEDYEGGDLLFKYPNSEIITKIEKKENRMVVWPSNFLYPHSVTKVEKGTRYSVVAWAS